MLSSLKMPAKRIVIDTNILVSAFLSQKSVPAQALNYAIHHDQPLASTATMRELIRVLKSPKFDPYVSAEHRDALVIRFAPLVEMVEVVQPVHVCRDADDDRVLEVAVNGMADTIISGDRDLLTLDPFRGIRIVTPRAYLDSTTAPS